MPPAGKSTRGPTVALDTGTQPSAAVDASEDLPRALRSAGLDAEALAPYPDVAAQGELEKKA